MSRVYAAVLVTHLPILAALLLPQGRSRVSSEPVAGLVALLLISLVVAATVLCPVACARVAPDGDRWHQGNALSQVRAYRRTDRRGYLWRLAELVILYTLAQCLGGLVAWMLPYIWDNPSYGTDPAADRWVFHYGRFAVQAVTLYVSVCVAFTWFACRLRQVAPPAH
ncbi:MULTISPECIES: hypothetical protein [Thermomonosporaceae]|uniref:hypothetical protein n=1 Tax=Thermomonosporaceae TaxID=2012 RepID=UPI00255B1651|nr:MULTISPECIES: hypothetical protein [Thermomonosporaceae]MDL4776246.1 hypothetical protein [Actinomadura xylanilytica]